MAYEDLIKSIESAADEKNREVLRDADREIEAILRETETELSAIHAQYLEKAKRDLALESNRQKFLAKQEVKRKVSSVRQQLIHEAIDKSLQNMAHIRSDSMYASLYERLVDEVIRSLAGEQIVLHIDPADATLCEKVFHKKGLDYRIEEDLRTIGGLCGTSADGKIRADNTLETRLSKIQEQSTLEIITLILGGPDG